MRFVININDHVLVKLNDRGREIHRKRHEQAFANHPHPPVYYPPHEDVEGRSKWSLWEVMQLFGPHMSLGSESPFGMDIEIK